MGYTFIPPLLRAWRQAAGFAREEMILTIVVAGPLTTFGIMGAHSLGWIGTGHGGGAEMAQMVQEVEAANLKFEQEYGVWPDEASDGSPAGNVAVLMDRRAAVQGQLRGYGFHPLIHGDLDTTAEGLVVRHRLGDGGVVRQKVQDGGTYRYAVTLNHLTLEQARHMDEAIDGRFNPEAGRLRISYKGGEANVSYLANPRGSDIAAR
jgi:hypothetical protein